MLVTLIFFSLFSKKDYFVFNLFSLFSNNTILEFKLFHLPSKIIEQERSKIKYVYFFFFSSVNLKSEAPR